MPIIQVNMLEGRTVAQKRAMISAVTDAVVGSLGVKRETVRIMINEMHAEHFALGGVSAGEQPLNKRNGHASNTNGNGAHAAERQNAGVTIE
jgi:4-oxalocrotonate tautomerase